MNAVTPSEPETLADFVVAAVHRQTSAEALKAAVEKRIADTVSSAVDGAMRDYGDVGKQIREAVAGALRIEGRIDVPAYGMMVMAVLRQQLDLVVGDLVNKRLADEMANILKIAPKEVKLTEVVDALKARLDQHDRFGSHVTCIVEMSDYGSAWVYIDEEQKQQRDKYACALQFGVDREGQIFHLKCDRKDVKTTIVLGLMHEEQKMVFGAYACGSKFIIDNPEPDTGIGDF